LQRY